MCIVGYSQFVYQRLFTVLMFKVASCAATSDMHVYGYTCLVVWTEVHAHADTLTCMHTHTFMHTLTHKCLHTYMHTYFHSHVHAYIHRYIQPYKHACMYADFHSHMRTYIFVCID